MYASFTVSLVIHLALLGLALVSVHQVKPLKIEVAPVEVALITEDDLIRLKKGDRDSKNLETQAAKTPSPTEAKKDSKTEARRAAEPPPPPPEPEAAKPAAAKPEAAPVVPPPAAVPPPPAADPIADKLASLTPPPPAGPTPEEIERQEEARAKADADAKAAEAMRKAEEAERRAGEAKRKAEQDKRKAEEEKRKAEGKTRKEREKRLAEEKRKAEEAKKKQKTYEQRMAALLNKLPDDKAPPSGSDAPATQPDLPKGPAAGAPEGRDDRLTASARSMIGVMMKAAVKRCWNINSGLEGADRVVVEMDVRLKPDGTLDGPPRVVSQSGPAALAGDAALSAERALVGCQPYDLPADLYAGGWDHMVVVFDPQKMF